MSNNATTRREVGAPSYFAISLESFLSWVRGRRAVESLSAIGASLGVSHVAVSGWLSGSRRPSKSAMILGGLLSRRDAGTWPLGAGD